MNICALAALALVLPTFASADDTAAFENAIAAANNGAVLITNNMVDKPFLICVRDNGHDYEVYLNGKQVGTGSYARPEGKTGFRWGMYLGAHEVKHEAMIFVSGANVDGV